MMDALRSHQRAGGCDECDCSLLAYGAGCERDGCAWADAGEHGPGRSESADCVRGSAWRGCGMAVCSYQMRQVFGRPRVLDVSQSLDRNGMPFLVVHVGVRSTFSAELRMSRG